MVGTLTYQHRSPDVRGVTPTLARRTKLAAASNPLTPAQNQLGGVAHAALRRALLAMTREPRAPDSAVCLC